MANFYPLDDESTPPRIRVSVRFEEEDIQDFKFIALLWNEYDKALGKKRRHKWTSASVIEQLLRGSRRSIWNQVGGRPATDSERSEFLKRAVKAILQEAAEHSAKKKKGE